MNAIFKNTFLFSPKFRILRHVSFWITYLLYSFIIYKFSFGFGTSLNFVFCFLLDIITVYFCLKYLIPKYIIEKLNITKFLYGIALVIFINFAINFINLNFIFKLPAHNLTNYIQNQFYNLQLSLIFIIGAIGIKIFKLNYESQNQIAVLEKEKIATELDFLKTQVNPHSLFNILNTIYIQTKIDPKISAEMVLKLSDLLRYQLYECSADKVLLKSEIEYLKNYVDLQKMRISNVDIKFEQNGSFRGLMIHPFIFLPFVENAFKHGIKIKSEKNFIYINVDIVENNVIFAVKNSKHDTMSKQEILKSSGLGLKNIRKRLELLYPGKYELKIDNGDNYFNVELKINLE